MNTGLFFKKLMAEKFLIVDCETPGLDGQTAAVATLLVEGLRPKAGYLFRVPVDRVRGTADGHKWYRDNVSFNLELPGLVRAAEHQFDTYAKLAGYFWQNWFLWQALGYKQMFADCPWPVEARFLLDCVDHQRCESAFEGPYPLLDIESMVRLAGIKDEDIPRAAALPLHNPMADCLYSLQRLHKALGVIGGLEADNVVAPSEL